MSELIQTITLPAYSFDVSVSKTEIFDIDMAKQLLTKSSISKEEQRKLKTYVGRRMKGNQVITHYVLGATTKSEMLGRFVAKGNVGLQTLPRDIRAALTKPYYFDIDMKNAQPTLMLQLAIQKGYEHTYLDKLVNSRDDVLAQIMAELGASRSEAKDRIIKLFFGSSYIDGLPEWIATGLYPEICKIKANIYASNLELAKKFKKNQNSVLSHVLQTIERDCLMAMDRALTRNKRSLDVLMHDGGLVRKLEGETEFPINLMRELEHSIYKDTGFRVSLHQKPIETSFEIEEPEFKIYPNDTIIDDLFAAKTFLELNKDNIVYSFSNIYIFNEATGVWSSDEAQLNTLITQAGNALIFHKNNPKGDGLITHNYSGSVKNRENMKKILPSILEQNNKFLYEGRKKSCFKLLFKNGIYDFETQTFYPNFNRSIVFAHAIPREFKDDVPAEDVDFVNNTFFVAPFSNADTPRVYRHYLMRGIIGDYRMKRFIVALGDKNSSKGLFTEFSKYALGGNVAEFNPNSLLLRKNHGDAEREMSWVYGICDSRLAISNEIKNTDDVRIDGNMLKTLTGGGDGITLRNIYKNSQVVVNQAMPILFAQDLPSISPPDAINSRIIVIQYDYSFMDSPNPNIKNEKQADPRLKDKLCDDKYADAFIYMMIQEYNNWADNDFEEIELPQIMLEDKQQIAPITDIRNVLEADFVITGNEEDWVPFKDIEDCLKKEKITMSPTRIGRELTRLGLAIKDKKVNRKTIKGRSGIKLAEDI
jgi:hypothetical protein